MCPRSLPTCTQVLSSYQLVALCLVLSKSEPWWLLETPQGRVFCGNFSRHRFLGRTEPEGTFWSVHMNTPAHWNTY